MRTMTVTSAMSPNPLSRPFWLAGALMLASLCLLVFSLPLKAQAGVPAPLDIPLTQVSPTVDGFCNTNEYANALRETFFDRNEFQGFVALQHDGSNLYVCMAGAPGSRPDRFATVYLDTDNGREALAESDDMALNVTIVDSTLSAGVGNSTGGYTPTLIAGWTAQAHFFPTGGGEGAEWSIPIDLVSEKCGENFGISVFHHQVVEESDHFGWPGASIANSPQSWQEARLARLICGADLSITKSDSPDPYLGGVLSYTVQVTNNGPVVATGVVATDTLPGGVTFLSASNDHGSCVEAAGVVTCTIGTLAVGETATITIAVLPTKTGAILNVAKVTGNETDPNLQNNEVREPTTIEKLGQHGKIAYVLKSDDVTANDFKLLLESRGFTVQLVPLGVVLTTNFAQFDLIIIADDTGSLNSWGDAAGQVAQIDGAHKPVIGLGEGGYAFFGQLGQPIGWPNGWHGPLDRVVPVNTALAYYHVPTDFGTPVPSPLGLYTAPVNHVGIYTPTVSGVLPLGLEPDDRDHAPLIAESEDCNQLWGFSAGPRSMTGDGQNLFVNAVVFGLARRCHQPPPPPQECLTVVKSAAPADGTPVQPGDIISYTVTYQVKENPACHVERAILEDPVPADTLFVPGSASDGIAPVVGVLRWNLGPLGPGASGSKSFQVYVMDTQCMNQRRVVNQARLVTNIGLFMSNLVTHPVECPPVIPAGHQPPWAEDEIQIYPYPLVTGQQTEVSVRIRNLSNVPQTVQVALQTSPHNFGIGIPFGNLLTVEPNPRTVVLPPLGNVVVKWHWTPTLSGHYCVLVRISGQGFNPIFTYRNLDVMEDLRPGVEDTLTFAVGNPLAVTANIALVVDNTCPGWTAFVDPAVLAGMAPGEIRTATLHVIPPLIAPLGTACHIDVQGWIGTQLIGGIRKLDVPPINLPHSDPPWEEKEIVTIPDPLVVGQPGQLCIQLNNPFPVTRTVSVDFAMADFGAGIPFTPVGSLTNLALPPNSFNTYCINHTPPTGGTLHRCARVTLHQAGFQDQYSQRNLDLRRPFVRGLSSILATQVPFKLGNTAGFTRTVDIDLTLIGLPPTVIPKILPDPPPELAPGEVREFTLQFQQAAGTGAASVHEGDQPTDEDPFVYGDETGVEVSLKLDGEEVGGFSVKFAPPPQLYLPLVEQ